MTVEASFVLPIFLFAMILIGYLGQMMRCQDEVQEALTRLAREASAEYGATESDQLKTSAYYTMKLNSYLKGTAGTITLLESHLLDEKDEIDLVARYQIQTPFTILGLGTFSFRQRVHTRAFTGVDTRLRNTKEEDCLVYVTETGRVYHRDLACTYLKLSISQVKFGDLTNLRNDGGGKYKACERCCKNIGMGAQESVWITSYGDCYHIIKNCSGLKRNIREIKLSEVGMRPPCSKCGTGNKKND